MAPAGRAFLKGAPYTPAHETPGDDYPLLFTTGRTVYQFHTRTKTGRARSLNQAAPDAWVELSPTDAAELGINEGDWVRVESPRGAIEVRARIGRVTPGAVFAPFHYGNWDPDDLTDADHRSANELTMTVWDPVSKQPTFKTAACRVTRLRAGEGPAPAPTNTASAPAPGTPTRAPATGGGAATSSHVLDETPHYALDPSQEN
jgi:anaerobic selenocysteine-containing dehydrogenase